MSTLLDPIEVTFDGSNHSFSFSPERFDVHQHGDYTLSWNLTTVNGGGHEAIFHSPYVLFDIPEEITNPFGSAVPGTGDLSVTVADDYDQASESGTFKYTVTVKFNGVTYSSDPMIVNKSPTRKAS